ncbi:hypothetical protein [Winogradskyella sp. A3E31]|uniref:hypothetical protein n=1 Tax=Winogradskyella sp. A3E31 TaxID=3349637 RepID=UPI00398B69EE
MFINRLLKIILLLLGAVYIVVQTLEQDMYGLGVSSVMLLLLIVLYFRKTNQTRRYFLGFLALYALSEISGFLSYYFPLEDDTLTLLYYGGNLLYISAYVLLIYHIISKLNFKTIISKFSVSLLILLVLSIFAVTLVTDAAGGSLDTYQYILEFTYNAVIMILLSVGLINYMYRNDTKAMLILIGTIFIFFSEVIQLADYYISESSYLSASYSIFLFIAFVCLYLQSQKAYVGPIAEYVDEDYIEEKAKA